MMKQMKNQTYHFKWENLTVHEKINVKQHAIDFYGKRWHTSKPNFCSKLNQLELCTILSWS
jgi:hypothetical protein